MFNQHNAFTRTKQHVGRPAFLVDRDAVVLDSGRQIDWDLVDSDQYGHGAVGIQLNGAVAKGATSITVDPLPFDIPEGIELDFGGISSVVVTFPTATAADATSVPVTALLGPIPSGAILYTGDAKEFIRLTAPAVIGAVSLTVEALGNALEGGEVATYQGGRKLVRTTAGSNAGGLTLAIAEAPFAIADNSIAYLAGMTDHLAGRYLPAGTCVALMADGSVIPRSAVTGSETAIGFLVTNANENSPTDAATGYGVLRSASVYENLLPEAVGAPKVINSAWKTELLARGGYWLFDQYQDTTA